MGLIRLISDWIYALRDKDTIPYKKNSDLQARYDAIKILKEEYPNNEEIEKEYYSVQKGLKGEDEVAFQLSRAHIGMYELRDIKLKYEDKKAQIDFVIITPIYTYYIECKNLSGNIIVNEKGDFILKKDDNEEGIPSPYKQIEDHRNVAKKMWEKEASITDKLIVGNKFDYWNRILVVFANSKTIIDTSKAPEDMKEQIIRADALVRKIEHDIETGRKKGDSPSSKEKMEQEAKSYCDKSIKEEIDFYKQYKKKYFNE